MAGFFIVVMMAGAILVTVGAMIGTILNYILDSSFITHIRRRTGQKGTYLGWIPFYSQYLLGQVAGMGNLGAVLGICHGLMAGLIPMIILVPELVNVWLSLIGNLTIGCFILKSVMVHSLYTAAMPGKQVKYTVIGVLTLGLARSILLFRLRKYYHAKQYCEKDHKS